MNITHTSVRKDLQQSMCCLDSSLKLAKTTFDSFVAEKGLTTAPATD